MLMQIFWNSKSTEHAGKVTYGASHTGVMGRGCVGSVHVRPTQGFCCTFLRRRSRLVLVSSAKARSCPENLLTSVCTAAI